MFSGRNKKFIFEYGKIIYKLIKKQKYNVGKLLRGIPVNSVELESMTLDKDDVRIARWYLKNRNKWYNDKVTTKFENEFKKWNSSKYIFTFLGGREALVAIIEALGLKPGDEVIIPGYTCVVVVNPFVAKSIDIKYCDIELDTFGLDADILKKKITKKTKAVLIHHLYGLVCRDHAYPVVAHTSLFC